MKLRLIKSDKDAEFYFDKFGYTPLTIPVRVPNNMPLTDYQKQYEAVMKANPSLNKYLDKQGMLIVSKWIKQFPEPKTKTVFIVVKSKRLFSRSCYLCGKSFDKLYARKDAPFNVCQKCYDDLINRKKAISDDFKLVRFLKKEKGLINEYKTNN
jgi:hypothetical protein